MKKTLACAECGRRFCAVGMRDHIAAKGAPHREGQAPPPKAPIDDDDDDDMGAIWAAHRQASAEKRAKNREASADILAAAGVAFESKNFGAHLIVSYGQDRIDFWAGTGLWRTRAKPLSTGRGVHGLLRLMGVQFPLDGSTMSKPATTGIDAGL